MPMDHYKVGPGTLTLGAGALAVHQQLRSCRVSSSESVSGATDDRKVLSGETVGGSAGTPSYAKTLTGTFLQDLMDGGVLDWSWTNEGTEQPFVYTPNTARGASISGVCVPVALELGGDVDEDGPESSFTWRVIGTPVPTWDS